MWESHVEIEGYSVVYFAHIVVFEALYCWTSIKGVGSYVLQRCMKVQRYGASKAAMQSKYATEYTFDFYTGLPHIVALRYYRWELIFYLLLGAESIWSMASSTTDLHNVLVLVPAE